MACNFWNHFIAPSQPTVIQLDTFTEHSNTIARAYLPIVYGGVVYGKVEFNTVYLESYDELEIASTIAHEIGHTLGIGWQTWMSLFDKHTGKFKPQYITEIPALAEMLVETDYDQGTRYAHWDEQKHGRELMTGLKNDGSEYVLPVTINVMSLLGHEVKSSLNSALSLAEVFDALRPFQFTRQAEAEKIARDYQFDGEIGEII